MGKIQNEDIKSAAELVSAGATAASLPNDDKVYVTANGVNKTLKQAILDGDIGGGGGSKNYLATKNGGFESNATTYWSLFNTTLTSLIPTGSITAGAASITTFAATATGKLAGNYSLNTASSGAMSAGQGFITDAFTIDAEDYATVMSFVAHYKVQSGTVNMSASSSNTFAFYIYDVTNSAWIQPAGVYGMDGSGKITGTFQTTAASTQYRLAVICINATGGAVSINWDDFSVGPQIVTQGAAITDWQSFTPTGSWTTNTSYTGKWRRVGDEAEIAILVTCSGAPTAIGLSVNLPSGLSIDTSKIMSANPDSDARFGQVRCLDVGINAYSAGTVGYSSSTSVAAYLTYTGATYGQPSQVSQVAPFTFGSGDQVSLIFSVPILGWSSNVQLSSDTDTRVVKASVRRSTSSQTIGTSATKVQFNGINSDSHGTFDSTTNYRYTIPVAGTYSFSGMLSYNAAAALLTSNVYLYKNGSIIKTGYIAVPNGASFGVPYEFQDDAVAGDYYEVFAMNTTSASLYSDGTINGGSTLDIKRLSGPATIAASETVAASYQCGSGQSLSSATTIKFDTKLTDSHGAYNTSTGIYTVPVSGRYEIGGQLFSITSTINWAFGVRQNGNLKVRSNTSPVYNGGTTSVNNQSCAMVTPVVIDCIAGDTLDFYITSIGNNSLYASTPDNYMIIKRIGN